MATEIPTTPPKKSGFPIWIPIVLAVAMMLFVFLAMAAFLALPFLLQLKNGGNSVPVFAAEDWRPRKIQEVTLEAPCDFGAGPNVASELPAEVQDLIESMDVFQSQGLPESMLIMVSRVKYVETVDVDLDGALQGAMIEAGGVVGDMNPQFTSKTVRVSNFDGRYGSYDHKFGKSYFRLRTIVAGKGTDLWQIQVIYEHEESAKDASRILKSVEIEF